MYTIVVSISEGQRWYREEYLASTHWGGLKDRVYSRFKACQICGKRYDLQLHHVSYKRRGMRREHKDVRLLCSSHHRRCHFVLWIIPLPKTPFFLYFRYLYVKIVYLLGQVVIWVYRSYRIENRPRRKQQNFWSG